MNPEKCVIRNATHRDYPGICRLFAEANAEHCARRPDLYRRVNIAIPRLQYHAALLMRDICDYQPVSLQVAECDGIPVGAAFIQSLSRSALSWSAFEKEACLDNIVVASDYRQHGIGTALLDAAKNWAMATGHAHMWAKIVGGNTASQKLFEKAGFSGDSLTTGLHLS